MKHYITLIFGILILLSACQIEKPSLPIWDVDLQIPLINEKYFVSDLADSLNISIAEDDLLYLTANGELDTPPLGQITIDPNISISNIPVLSGLQVSDAVDFLDTGGIAELSYGEVASGSMRVMISDVHPDADDWTITLTLDDITTAGGSPLQLSYSQATPWQTVDLSGHHFGVLDSGEIMENIRVNFSASSELPDGAILADLSIDISNPISFSVFQGVLNNYEIPAQGSASSIDIEYPNNVDQALTLHDALIRIQVFNQSGFSCEFVGWFKGISEDNEVIIPIVDHNGNNYQIAPATQTDATTLEFSNQLTELMQMMPETIEIIDSKFIISTASGIGTIRETDTINALYTAYIPFRFTLHDYPISIKSPTKISISAENRDRIRENVREAGLELDFLNTIPIGATAFAYFADHIEIDPEDPESYSYVKQMSIGSSQLYQDWQDLEPLSLNRAELDLFSSEEVYLKWVFHFDESDGPIEIHAGIDDYLWIKGQIQATLRVEDL